MSFSTRNLSVRYPDSPTAAIRDLTITIPAGCFFAIIGPNGSGKSTLLRALLGAIPLTEGHVVYEERPLAEWSRADLARRIGVVTQSEEMPFPVSVRDLVAMGRYPHLGALRPERAEDRAAVHDAMLRCNVNRIADRVVATLSGGERQRARIARALAQTPATLLLDEPTAALDIAHEMAVFELIRSLAHDEGRTVIVATHHINLAARYADQLLLLKNGRAAATGSATAVMRKEILEDVYQWPLSVLQHEAPGFDNGAPQITPLSRNNMESL